MKNYLLIFAFLLSNSFTAQNVLLSENFSNYAGTSGSVPAGWYFSYQGNYTSTISSGTSGPNSYKFGINGASIISPKFKAGLDTLSFWCKGNGTDPLSKLKMYESRDSSEWVLMDSIFPIPTTGTNKKFKLNISARWVKFMYEKSVGNLAFDDFKITQYPSLIAGFSVSSACQNSCSAFTDKSLSLIYPIKKRTWFFGDGDTSTSAHPCHTYTSIGTYHALLIIEDSIGSIDTVTQVIEIHPKPIPAFTWLNCGGLNICCNAIFLN